MGKRGTKPSGKLSVIEPTAPQRPGAPDGMTDRARDSWVEIVASLPVEHFKAGDYPLLRAYCEAEALHFQATDEIVRTGAVITNERSGAMRANPWVAIQTQTAHTMAQLAQKLNICRSSRRKAEKNGEQKPKSKREGLMFGGNG